MMPTQLPSIEIEIVAANVSADLASIQKWRESLWAEFGQLKIADSTRKQYVRAIENFCKFAYSGSATPATISEFLDLDRYAAIEMVFHLADLGILPAIFSWRYHTFLYQSIHRLHILQHK